jgi:hypothetical protein
MNIREPGNVREAGGEGRAVYAGTFEAGAGKEYVEGEGEMGRRSRNDG